MSPLDGVKFSNYIIVWWTAYMSILLFGGGGIYNYISIHGFPAYGIIVRYVRCYGSGCKGVEYG